LHGGRIYANGAVDTGRYNPRFIFRSDILPTPVFRFAIVQGQNISWLLRRNCSVTPAQLGWLYASLCALSLGVGTFFWFQGAVLVLPFAWLELAAVGVAFFAYARHAADGETIQLRGRQLVVELESAGQRQRAEFDREWVRVEPSVADRSLVELSGQGRRVNIGRYVRPELRPLLAQEIRRALREGAGQPRGDSGAIERR
jgi:uncharacterized membrane protein